MLKFFNLYILYMKILLSYCATIIIVSDNNYISNVNNTENNETPIIGVLSQEISPNDEKISFGLKNEKQQSYIPASYIKFVESAGARATPIWIGKEEKYYEDILSKVNGVLFPGGAVYFNRSNGYADAGMLIFKIAKKMNDNGIYFPLWGTCLGFELLSYLSANRIEHRADCSSNNQALNLEFKSDYRNSRLFGQTPAEVIEILQNENVTSNFHRFCITEKNLTDFNLNDQWKVLTVNKDWNGFEFVSSFEHKKYPFYGIQFHPEKNLYEWIQNRNISHTPNAILASQYFANFFVNETRKNTNKFSDKNEEIEKLIYNYQPKYTGDKGSVFEQIYVFPQSHNGIQYCEENDNEVEISTLNPQWDIEN